MRAEPRGVTCPPARGPACTSSVARASPRMPIDVRHELPDLRRVHVDVDDLRVRRERRRLARHAIVEPAADVEQHVAPLDRAIDVHPAVHARHAEAELG